MEPLVVVNECGGLFRFLRSALSKSIFRFWKIFSAISNYRYLHETADDRRILLGFPQLMSLDVNLIRSALLESV